MHIKSWKAREVFGFYLKRMREKAGLSILDLSYILNVSHVTVYDWEQGKSIPQSIIRLKQLAHIFPRVPAILKGVLREIGPSESEWKRIQRVLISSGCGELGEFNIGCRVYHNDVRDDRYRIAFGRYLQRMRLRANLTCERLARAVGVTASAARSWEAMGQFSRDFYVLGLLDRIYGGRVLDVLFGICPKHGIRLRKREIFALERRRRGCAGLKKCVGWRKHHERLYYNVRAWNMRQVGVRKGFVNRTLPE